MMFNNTIMPGLITLDCVQISATNNIDVFDWPFLSLDLSTIEHLWDKLGHMVYRPDHSPTNFNELHQALIQEWQHIPSEDL